MYDRIRGYFSSIWGSGIEVSKVEYDADDIETTDSTLVVKAIYTVTISKRISQASFTSAVVIPGDAMTATVAVESTQLSS